MEKTITTSLMIAVSMILVIMLFNIAYPAVIQGGEAVTGMASSVADRMKTQITVIHASSENGKRDIAAWVKNVGDATIIAVTHVDVFFGPEGNFIRIPHETQAAQGTFPYWTAQVEGGGDWSPTGTLEIVIHNRDPLAAGRYYLKFSLPNGVSSEYFLGI